MPLGFNRTFIAQMLMVWGHVAELIEFVAAHRSPETGMMVISVVIHLNNGLTMIYEKQLFPEEN